MTQDDTDVYIQGVERMSRRRDTTTEEDTMTTDSYSRIEDHDAYTAAQALAKGDYQRRILSGAEAMSGSTIKGTARRYSSGYRRSREGLLSRMTAAGIKWTIETGPRGRRVLVIG